MSQEATCPECDGCVDYETTETVCRDCGLVVGEDPIDYGPEWRNFDDGVDRSRTGAPLTRSRHDRGLSTKIGRSTRLKGRKRRQLTRMRREHNRARIATKADRNEVYAFTEIRRLVGALSLPQSVRDQACALFDSAQSEDLLRGRSLEGFAAAAVYAVCRTNGISRTLEEVVEAARADAAELRAAYDAMNRELGLPTGPIDPTEYLPRFATALDLPPRVESRAREYVAAAEERHLVSGKHPGGVAAACLYLAAAECDRTEDVTQAAAAEAAGVTPVTLRSTYTALQSDRRTVAATSPRATAAAASGSTSRTGTPPRRAASTVSSAGTATVGPPSNRSTAVRSSSLGRARLRTTAATPASSVRASARVRTASVSAGAVGRVTSTQASEAASGTPASTRSPAGQSTTTAPYSRSTVSTVAARRRGSAARAPASDRPQGSNETDPPAAPSRTASTGSARPASTSWRSGPRPAGRSAIDRSPSTTTASSSAPRFSATVDFPTPPFPPATARITALPLESPRFGPRWRRALVGPRDLVRLAPAP